MTEKKQIRIWVDIEDYAEYGYEANELLKDKKKANAMIKAVISYEAQKKREKRLGVKYVSEQPTGKPIYNSFVEITSYE